jgi:phosphatidylinositol alpha-mannosyltransferase
MSARARVATFHSYCEQEPRWSRFFRRHLGRLQLARFDRAIAVSPPASEFARAVWTRALALIPNGVDTAVFSPRTAARDGDGLRLLFVGHWHNPRKGLPTLLDAVVRLRARGVPVALHVIGDGAARDPVPGVRYHPAISDERRLAEHYRAADVFVAPSLGRESFGIVLLEAMACGRPIVCSDIEGYRSVVPPSGARWVPPADPTALADALGEVAADPARRARMAALNRRAALAFDWSRIAGRVRDEYLAALEGRGLRRFRARAGSCPWPCGREGNDAPPAPRRT